MAGLGAVAAIYVMGLTACKPGPDDGHDLGALAKGSMAKLQAQSTPGVQATAPFTDASGKSVDLSKFKGQVVVLNLWATWCGPCVKEMPTLAKLQADFAGRPLKVVAVSTDSDSQVDKAKVFLAARPPLAFYHDSGLKLVASLTPRTDGFPATYLFDKKGQLKGVLQGEADWASPEAEKVVAALLGS
jgi:thiol-disulfide isomerase/thioredoxin